MNNEVNEEKLDVKIPDEIGTRVQFKPGEKIYEPDYLISDHCVYYIEAGSVEIRKRYTPLQSDTFELKPGDIFGMLEVYLGTNRISDAVAKSAVSAVAFSRVEFEKSMVSNLGFALQTIRILSKMLRQVNGRIKQLPYEGGK